VSDVIKQRIVRKNLLIEAHGPPDEQMEKLVCAILNQFEDPELWPMDDGSRIAFLKRVYADARRIRETERAIDAAQP